MMQMSSSLLHLSSY